MEKIKQALKKELEQKKLSGDIYMVQSKDEEVTVNSGKIEKIKASESFGAAVRIFKEGKMGFGYFTVKDPEEAAGIISRTEKTALIEGYESYKLSPACECAGVLCDDGMFDKFSVENKKKAAFETEEKTAGFSGKIKFARDTAAGAFRTKISLFNTEGFDSSFSTSYYYARVTAVSSDGKSEEAADGFYGSTELSKVDFKGLAQDTAKRAEGLLGGSSVKSGRYTLIIPPRAGVEFLELISQLFLASNIRKRKSMLKDYREGDKIGPEKLNIRDNSLFDYRIGSYPFDAEGMPGQNTAVVEKGKLKTFLYDSLNAAYFGKSSTGNAARADFKNLPDTGTSNFYIESGKSSKDEVISSASGIMVNSMMGLHMADPVSGNFSLGINGWLMEKGRVIQPVKETLISGNIKDMLLNTGEICGDLTFYYGYGAPTFTVNNVTVSGKN